MASDSSEEEIEDWVFYRDRLEWKDVTPIEQDEGPFSVVAIAYSEKCTLICFMIIQSIKESCK